MYDGIGIITTEIEGYEETRQIRFQLHGRANPRYIGINKFTDNLGNEYNVKGGSWTLEDKTREGFMVEELSPEAKSISFKYWLARKTLDFQLTELPIPS